MLSVCLNAPKKLLCYLNASWKICYMKANINFRVPGTDNPQSVGSRTLFCPISIMPNIFIKDYCNLKHPKIVKSINNVTSSHLVSCRIISRPTTMKGWEKDVFWKILALGNLKCNKRNNLKSKQNSWKNIWKVTVLKASLLRKIVQAFC